MKPTLIIIFTTIIVLMATSLLFAQAPPPPPFGPEQAPIDGGLGILAALGGAYALKKLKEGESKK